MGLCSMGIAERSVDAVIIGAGGSGLRAALQLQRSGFTTAVVSKVFPTRSHTVSAQGGITCALGNAHDDQWQWHMYDTVKGSDYLGDQDCIEYMCKTGPEVVYELEHMGLPFSRMDDGRIYQRQFGGQSKNFGGEQAQRTCAAADRTGHALLHTLYQQNLAHGTQFLNEWYAIDFVKDSQNQIAGVTVLNMESGDVVFLKTRAVVLATGGAGRIYETSTNAYINTGDGLGMVLRAGYPLQDMEMWQFHPTGIAGVGCLMTEGCRGEGGYLVNKNGERFMERYAPNAKDLASRDVVSRAIAVELREGRGFNPDGLDYVHLKLDHLGADVIKTRLPGIRELAMTFAHVDPIKDPIPVVPTCHYMMGGIPTNIHGQVLTVNDQGQDNVIQGLYAVGECANVSVHGANRLGGNSLLDLVVFGRAAGMHVEQMLREGPSGPDVTHEHVHGALARLHRWQNNKDGESPAKILKEIQQVMQKHFGVFRTQDVMQEGLTLLNKIGERLQHATLTDQSKVFNTALIEALELDNIFGVAHASAMSAMCRQESRGAHSREDYTKRDDVNWLKHILYFSDERLAYRPVNMKPSDVEPFQPKDRVY
jgi:succinate dehydrogenase / fumarate reductase flavoprotein subunit